MTTGLDVFDATVQQTNLWLKDIMEQINTEDRHLAYQLLRATLHAIRDRIGPENAVHFGAQLPMLIRGFYYEGWHMAGTPTKTRDIDGFLNGIQREIKRDLGTKLEPMVKTVFEVIAGRIDAGEVKKLVQVFPQELKPLWRNEFRLA